MTFLKRQSKNHKRWFWHLDFLKMGVESIKKIFSTKVMQSTHGTFVDPLLDIRSDLKMIKDFFSRCKFSVNSKTCK